MLNLYKLQLIAPNCLSKTSTNVSSNDAQPSHTPLPLFCLLCDHLAGTQSQALLYQNEPKLSPNSDFLALLLSQPATQGTVGTR